MRRHVFPTAPSPTTTHLMVCILGGEDANDDCDAGRDTEGPAGAHADEVEMGTADRRGRSRTDRTEVAVPAANGDAIAGDPPHPT